MRIEEAVYEKGYIRLSIESEDDLWVLSMFLEEDDIVSMRTLRDVSIEGSGKKRLPMTLAIRVKRVEFQPFSGRLRVGGVIVEGPEEYGLRGSHHTFSIDIGSRLEIIKREGYIDKRLLDRLIEATNRGRRAVLVALDYDSYCIQLLQGQGLRTLLEGFFPTISKRDEASQREFWERLTELGERVREFEKTYRPVAIVIGSPGDLAKRLSEILSRDIESRVYTDTVSLGGCEGVEELIRRGVVRRVLETYSEVRAEEIMEEYMSLLVRDPERVSAGIDNVLVLSRIGAVEKVVIIDTMMRSDRETRDKIAEIIGNTVEKRGEVVIVSESSGAGRRLVPLGGVVAVLRFRASPETLSRET